MSCIDKPLASLPAEARSRGRYRCVVGSGLAALLALAGCSNPPPTGSAGTGPAAGAASPGTATAPRSPGQPQSSAPVHAPAAAVDQLGPPKTPRSHAELRRQAAQRLVAANPDRCYMGVVPEVLLAIPVLEVELASDGHVRHIKVLRRPGQALDTVQLAMDAVHRAAPYGNVSALPKPWVFNETFLFNDQRKFKPRTLDE